MKADKFKNDLFKNVGLQAERIQVGSNFSEETIRLRNMLL